MVLLSSILSDFVRREMDSYEVIKDGVGTNGQKLQIWFQFSYLVTFCHCESEVPQLCLTLCNPMNCSLLGSSIYGIFQARILEWGAIAFSALQPLGSLKSLLQHRSLKASILLHSAFFMVQLSHIYI